MVNGFRQTILDCHLHDLGMIGHSFTWERRCGLHIVEERLDRALAIADWMSLFKDVVLRNINTVTSDHSNLFLHFLQLSVHWAPKHFCFENAWARD